jgi:hypothetical protein
LPCLLLSIPPISLERQERKKGKDIARDDMSSDPTIERLESNLSSDSMVNRVEDGTQKNFSIGEAEK